MFGEYPWQWIDSTCFFSMSENIEISLRELKSLSLWHTHTHTHICVILVLEEGLRLRSTCACPGLGLGFSCWERRGRGNCCVNTVRNRVARAASGCQPGWPCAKNNSGTALDIFCRSGVRQFGTVQKNLRGSENKVQMFEYFVGTPAE